METIKICYFGDDESVYTNLQESFRLDGKYYFEAVSHNESPKWSAECVPDVIAVDRPAGGSPIPARKLRSMAQGVDLVLIFLFRERSVESATEALSSGYDLCWDALGVESSLFRATLEREISKKKESAGRDAESLLQPQSSSTVLNETVAALVEGSVELLAVKEDLEKHNRELELVRDELEQFVHTVSHDLKEPLMALRTFTKILLDDLGPMRGSTGEHLQMITQSVERMSKQIDGLLAFSRAGRVKPDSLVEDPARIISDIQHDRGFDRREDVSIKVQSALPPLKAHTEQLKQIFGNLISNGLKYNRSPHKTVEIGIATAPPKEIEASFPNPEEMGEFLLLYVSDNGIGIPPDDRIAPFELFRRLDESPEFEGDGAGLAIVKRAVNSLGGAIDYTSQPGKGTAMYFTLPYAAKAIHIQTQKPTERKRSAAQLRDALFKNS